MPVASFSYGDPFDLGVGNSFDDAFGFITENGFIPAGGDASEELIPVDDKDAHGEGEEKTEDGALE
jgi:hypothetical protein